MTETSTPQEARAVQRAPWKPDRSEAQFLGEVLNISPELAKIARDMLAKGTSLASTIDCFKQASSLAALIQKGPKA